MMSIQNRVALLAVYCATTDVGTLKLENGEKPMRTDFIRSSNGWQGSHFTDGVVGIAVSILT
jgi:hypothetical protein